MIKDLVKLANHLDSKGLQKEADVLDRVITKLSQDSWWLGNNEEAEQRKQNELAVATTVPLQEHSAFRSAESAGSQAAIESVKTKASTAMGKTLDFYEQEVFDKLIAGQQVSVQITEPLLIGLIKPEDHAKHGIFSYHFEEMEGSIYQQVWLHKTASNISDKDSLKTFNFFIDSNGMKFEQTEGKLANLKTAYNLMEQSVIKYNLNVQMESFLN